MYYMNVRCIMQMYTVLDECADMRYEACHVVDMRHEACHVGHEACHVVLDTRHCRYEVRGT